MLEYYLEKYDQCNKYLSVNEALQQNILFRIKSIFYHLEILASYQYSIRTGKDDEKSQENNLIYTTYIFEDILFNLSTFYDYLANFIVKYYTNRTEKYTWNKLVNIIRNNQSFLKNRSLIDSIIECNSRVNKLQEYRSEIIHYNIEKLEFKIIDDLNKTIQVPKKLSKLMSMEQLVKDSKDINLRVMVHLLTVFTLDDGLIILGSIVK